MLLIPDGKCRQLKLMQYAAASGTVAIPDTSNHSAPEFRLLDQ